MSTHHVSCIRNTAVALFMCIATGMTPKTATADSTTTSAHDARGAQQSEQPDAACIKIDRPKHTISRCKCATGALSGMTSIDAAEIVRLLTGDYGCRNPVASHK